LKFVFVLLITSIGVYGTYIIVSKCTDSWEDYGCALDYLAIFWLVGLLNVVKIKKATGSFRQNS
jgi:hypothetical protein